MTILHEYCSDVENEHHDDHDEVEIIFDKKYTSILELREEINDTINEVKMFCDNPKKSKKTNKYKNELRPLIPKFYPNSMYCDNSDESIEHGLDIHDYRISLVNYRLIYNEKN